MKYYRLNVSYRLRNGEDLNNRDRIVVRIVGRQSDDSGAGFGMRDLGWIFSDKTKVDAMAEKLRMAGYQNVVVTEHDDGQ